MFEVDPGAAGKNWKPVLEFDHALASTLKVGVFALNTTTVEYAPRFAAAELMPKK